MNAPQQADCHCRCPAEERAQRLAGLPGSVFCLECGTDAFSPHALLPALGRPVPAGIPPPRPCCHCLDWCGNTIGQLVPCPHWSRRPAKSGDAS
jgi:hypothetical protein